MKNGYIDGPIPIPPYGPNFTSPTIFHHALDPLIGSYNWTAACSAIQCNAAQDMPISETTTEDLYPVKIKNASAQHYYKHITIHYSNARYTFDTDISWAQEEPKASKSS